MSDREEGPVAIVTALWEELDPILRRAERVRRADGGWQEGWLAGAAAVFAAGGDGPRAGFASAAALCRAVRPRLLLGAGVAGALTADLAVEDLLVARRIRDDDGDAPDADPAALHRAVSAGPARAGTLVTVDRPITGAGEKASLAASLGIDGPAAVDMESAAWARAARASGVPFLIVRAVIDRRDEELPAYLSRCVGADGRLRRSAVVLAALRHPSTLPRLARMRRRMKACGERLASFLERLLGDGL